MHQISSLEPLAKEYNQVKGPHWYDIEPLTNIQSLHLLDWMNKMYSRGVFTKAGHRMSHGVVQYRVCSHKHRTYLRRRYLWYILFAIELGLMKFNSHFHCSFRTFLSLLYSMVLCCNSSTKGNLPSTYSKNHGYALYMVLLKFLTICIGVKIVSLFVMYNKT